MSHDYRELHAYMVDRLMNRWLPTLGKDEFRREYNPNAAAAEPPPAIDTSDWSEQDVIDPAAFKKTFRPDNPNLKGSKPSESETPERTPEP